MDTIFALATARGKAGVAIIRISGPEAMAGLRPFIGSFGPPRQAVLRLLRDGHEIIDQALVLCFAADRSFTGEEVVELHLHGAQAIVARSLDLLSKINGFRLAEPGEFTRRALENGRLDLAQVEGLSDLIEAETEAQRRQAMTVFSGELGRKTEVWRAKILRAAALMEAVIDFADEDVPVDVRPEVTQLIEDVVADLRREVEGFAAAERIRDGFEVAIIGQPNAGKSTLLNRLAGREAAITSDFAGTTRDVIEVRMDIDGLAVTLLDTAGLREAQDPVEAIGIARARERALQADLRIFLLDASLEEIGLDPLPGDLIVQGKADAGGHGPHLAISGKTGQGVDALIRQISAVLSEKAASSATITRARHRDAVLRAIDALDLAQKMLHAGDEAEEIVAEALRQASQGMDSLVGRIGVEDLLGEIFASFCIGK